MSTDQDVKKKILIIEDESMVAMLLEDIMLELGHEVVGVIAEYNDALQAARERDIDLALLDINLGGELIYPVADILKQRGIRFIFTTGYVTSSLPKPYADIPVLTKPYEVEQVEDAIAQALASDIAS